MFYTNKALACGQSISVLHDPAPGWHHLPSLLSHASVYLPSHPFQTILHSHFATFFFFFLLVLLSAWDFCLSLFVHGNPKILLTYWATTVYQMLCWEAETQRERWLALIWVEWLGVKAEEIDCPTKAWIQAREPWIFLGKMGMNNRERKEAATELGSESYVGVFWKGRRKRGCGSKSNVIDTFLWE